MYLRVRYPDSGSSFSSLLLLDIFFSAVCDRLPSTCFSDLGSRHPPHSVDRPILLRPT